MKKILELLATAAGVWVAVRLVPGLDFTGSNWALAGITLLIAAANLLVRPLLKLFTFPLIILTLGLFLLVVNAVILQIVVWISAPERLDLSFTSTGFFWATFLGALVISVVRAVLDALFIKD